MKKWMILVTAFVGFSPARAQQRPHYTQYVLNQYIINPALSGIENYTDVKLSHRHQWTGISGSPVTTYFTIQGPVGKKDYRTTATSFSLPGRNPRGEAYWENYTAAEPHHGLGMQIINDRAGALNNFSAYGTYAYHLGLSPRLNLSAGFGAGISNFRLDASKLRFASVDPAVYTTGLLNSYRFDMNAGLYLYGPDFFLGLSAQQLVPSRIDYSNNAVTTASGRQVPHLFATAGYRTLLSENWNLLTSVMVKYVRPLPVQPELNFKFQYNDLFWLGTGYRYKDGFTGLAGLNVSNSFNLSYSYDYTRSGLKPYSGATHELTLGFLLGNRYGDTCPRNVW